MRSGRPAAKLQRGAVYLELADIANMDTAEKLLRKR
jgi:hypothetical protein